MTFCFLHVTRQVIFLEEYLGCLWHVGHANCFCKNLPVVPCLFISIYQKTEGWRKNRCFTPSERFYSVQTDGIKMNMWECERESVREREKGGEGYGSEGRGKMRSRRQLEAKCVIVRDETMRVRQRKRDSEWVKHTWRGKHSHACFHGDNMGAVVGTLTMQTRQRRPSRGKTQTLPVCLSHTRKNGELHNRQMCVHMKNTRMYVRMCVDWNMRECVCVCSLDLRVCVL